MSRAHLSGFNGYNNRTNNYSKDRTPERSISVDLGKPMYEHNGHSKRLSVPKMIEERLNTFEPKILEESEVPENGSGLNVNLTNVNVLKRRELFEKEKAAFDDFNKVASRVPEDLAASLSIKERLMNLEKRVDGETVKESSTKTIQLPNEFSGVKEILTSIEKPTTTYTAPVLLPQPVTDVPIVTIHDRVNNIQSEIPCTDDEQNSSEVEVESSNVDDVKECDKNAEVIRCVSPQVPIQTDYLIDVNNEDSGIHTADTSIYAPSSEDINQSRDEIEKLKDVEENPIQTKMSDIVEVVPDVIPIVDHHRSSIDGSNTSIKIINDLSAEPAADLEECIEQDTSVSQLLDHNQLTVGVTQMLNSQNGDTINQNSINSVEDVSAKIADVDVESNSSNSVDTKLTFIHNSNHSKYITSSVENLDLNLDNAPISNDKIDLKVENSIENNIQNDDIFPLNLSKNERIKCQIVGVLEKNRISSAISPPKSPPAVAASVSPPLSPLTTVRSYQIGKSIDSPTSPKSPSSIKVLDFIKRNLLNDHLENENSTFYVPLISNNLNDYSDNLPKEKQVPGDNDISLIKTDSSDDSNHTSVDSSEINCFLDEVLNKLDNDE